MDETRIERALRQGPPFRTAYVSRPLALETAVVAAPGLGGLRLVALAVLTALVVAASLAALAVGGFLRPPIHDLATRPVARPLANAWTQPAGLPLGRRGHTATLLADGEVLVVGGATTLNSDLTSSAELYEPATGTWVAAAPTIGVHARHTATLLRDGKVLVAGGGVAGGGTSPPAEVFDPTTGSWTATGPMSTRLSGHSATLLADGSVLVAGGHGAAVAEELFDPATGTWRTTAAMAHIRVGHTATLLRDGRVLVVGGTDPSKPGADLATAELYDPSSGTWSVAGTLPRTFLGHTATLLPDGSVLVAGGWHSGSGPIEGSAILYDPTKDTWTPAPDLLEARGGHTATLLPDGRVLVAGGFGKWQQACGDILKAGELYDPVLRSWSPAAPMASVRYAHEATALADGTVLVTGGTDTGCMRDPLTSVELYGAAPR